MTAHTDAPCLTCEGSGTVVIEPDDLGMLDDDEETCRDCGGSGCDDECRECSDEALVDWHWEHHGRGPTRVGGGV